MFLIRTFPAGLAGVIAVVKRITVRREKILETQPCLEIRQAVKTEMPRAAIDPVLQHLDIIIQMKAVIPVKGNVAIRRRHARFDRGHVVELALADDDAEAVDIELQKIPLRVM